MSESVLSDADSLVLALTAALAPYWPDLYGKLGVRFGDYIEAARRKAANHQIVQDAAVARYVSLCCALGPNFEDKPENEWALALLADERLEEWVRVHQLVVRSTTELDRRPGDGRLIAAQVRRADVALLDLHDAQRRSADSDAPGLTRVACDLEAVDLRLLELDWRREYRKMDGSWQLLSVPDATASVRMGPGRPAPAMICVLARAPKQGPTARLQIRLLTHARCNQDHHPLVTFAGSHGLSQWRGHLAQAVSWLVHARSSSLPANESPMSLIQETIPETSLLRATSCGLRDEGVPSGSLQTYVWAYPADQWLFTLQREGGPELRWPRPAEMASGVALGVTRCRLERDGVALPCALWVAGFQDGLHGQLSLGFDKLFSAWQRATQDSSMTAAVTLLTGKATLTWGWREGEEGLAGPPLMRVVGELDLNNAIDLELTGEVEVGVTRTRVRLIVRGEAPMKHELARENAVPSLFDVLLPTATHWKMGFQIEFDPVAVDEAAVWREAGPCNGSLLGEVGLRPRLTGGGGWQWYARLSTEPISVPICVCDPVLGNTYRTLFLLPGVNLLDWSLD